MRSFHPTTESAVFATLAGVIVLSATLGAAPQAPATDPPVSVDRIRKDLAKTPPPRLKLDRPVDAPIATFKTKVEERVYVLTLEQQLDKQFDLTGLSRQSAEWASKCCGLSLDPLIKGVENALQRRKVRKIREEIARELAALEAARKEADAATSSPRPPRRRP